MPREDRIHDLRDHRVVVSDDARKYRAPLAQPRHQVLAQLIFHAPRAETLCSESTLAQFAKSPGGTHGGKPPKETASCGLSPPHRLLFCQMRQSEEKILCCGMEPCGQVRENQG